MLNFPLPKPFPSMAPYNYERPHNVARRGARMFEKVKPLMGVVENMSYFEAPDGSRQELFGSAEVKQPQQQHSAPCANSTRS